ncbi:MAG: penicillin acylase family protein [Thermoanaerobaculaceae bacterium]
MKKKLLVIAGTLAGLLSALFSMALYLFRASLFVPAPSNVALPGLQRPCTVYFDAYGVPHVIAETVEDVFFVQGYLHAKERFFQMELSRRAAAGRLAELLGPKAVAADERFRRWGLGEAVREQRRKLPQDVEQALVAYSLGVNAAITSVPVWRLAPECAVLLCPVEPWTVEDTLGVGLLLQQQLTWAAGEELKRARQLQALGKERAVELWGWRPEEAQAWIPEDGGVGRQPVASPLPVFSGVGSNNWVVAGTASATGKPLLANDPHVGVANPATWYEIHLKTPTLQVAGASVPGAPGILIGHNGGVAWGLTMVMLDDQDLFRLTLDQSGTQERFAGGWRPLQMKEEEIKVRGEGKPRKLVCKRSIHGPVISEEKGEALALAWTALLARSTIECFLRLNWAENITEAMDSFNTCESPAMNLLVADRQGQIGWQVTGRVPRRGRGGGKLPAPGGDPAWAWQGFEPFSRNPRVIGSPSGVLATANHDPFKEGDFPPHLAFSGEFAPPDRVRTVRAALFHRQDWDVDGFLQLQMDVANPQALTLLRALAPFLEGANHPAARALLAWDGQMLAERTEPLLWAEFLRALLHRVGDDEAQRAGLASSPMSATALLRLLAGELSQAWWDDVNTSDRETPQMIIGKALQEAAAKAGGRTWGQAHQLTFAHPLGSVPGLGAFFTFGPHPVAGAGPCINSTAYDVLGGSFAVVALPSLRFVADLANWDNSKMVLPLGQSGHPMSAHARDQFPLWLRGQAHGMPFSQEAVERAAVQVSRLVPKE